MDVMMGLKGALEKEVRAQRRTRKEVGLGNALPWMLKDSKAHSKRGEGSEVHSKGGRVRKCTTLDGQRLEGTLERR
jgi:hypothetical protein